MDLAYDRKIAVFLDYDGTLSPIVDDPDCAFMSEEVRTRGKQTSPCFTPYLPKLVGN